MDTIDRLPQTGSKGIYLKQQLRDKLIELHRRARCGRYPAPGKEGPLTPTVRDSRLLG